MKCESCKIYEATIEEPIDDSTSFKLCTDCHGRLITYSLRPLEYFNLAATHGHQAYIHDDLYENDNGEACQPKIIVVDAELFPFPKFDEIQGDLKLLVDFTCVMDELSDEVINAIKKHNPSKVLEYLQLKVGYSKTIREVAYSVAGATLGALAAAWLRNEWHKRNEKEIWFFAEPVAQSLPFEEAFEMLTKEIEKGTDKNLAENCGALIYFQDAKTLDWIEANQHRITNVVANWGVLAAASQFTFDRAKQWLESGRPLSLIALDALKYCTTNGYRSNQSLWFIKHPPVSMDPPVNGSIIKTINQYLEKDNVPRTRTAVKKITSNLKHNY